MTDLWANVPECPSCGGVEGEHGPECAWVEHVDQGGTCSGCGEDYSIHRPSRGLRPYIPPHITRDRREYMREYRERRKANDGKPLRVPPLPYMSDLVRAAWLRVGRESKMGYDFVCNCGVCAVLRAKTQEPDTYSGGL